MMNRQIEVSPTKSVECKDMVVLKIFYKIVRILCCFDFGFYEHKPVKRRVFWKTITILHSVLLMSVAFYFSSPYEEDFFFEFVLYFCYYFIVVLILISLNPNKTFCQLHRDLKTIDNDLQISSNSFKLHIKIVICTTLLYVSSIILDIYHCYTKNGCTVSIISTIMFQWLVTSIRIVDSSCAFLFYSIYCRLKSFSFILKIEDRDNLSMQRIYQSIANLAELHKSALDPLFLLLIIFTIYDVMGNILIAVEEMRLTNSIAPRSEFFLAAVSLMCMSAQVLSAEFLSIEQKKIILILHEKLIHQRESSRQRELERFIQYVQARPLRFRLYRVIPLDADLLGVVLNFSVTYLIVIIQFTYK